MNEVKSKYVMNSLSMSTLFGKTPKINAWCGKCGYPHKFRADMDILYSNKCPRYICQACGTKNVVMIGLV